MPFHWHIEMIAAPNDATTVHVRPEYGLIRRTSDTSISVSCRGGRQLHDIATFIRPDLESAARVERFDGRNVRGKLS